MKSKINFIEGNTTKCLFKMVMPLLMAMVLTMAYNLVDSLWVGNMLGANGYAALTNSTAIILILNAIAMGSSNGIAILVSQSVGAGKQKESDKIISTLIIMSIIFSVAVTFVSELLLKQLIQFMNTPSEIFTMAYNYLSIYFLGYAAVFVYMQFTAVFRSYGDPMFQMKGMLICTLFNAVIDPIMIKFMGLNGAAWATVLSELLCVLLSAVYYKKKKMFKISIKSISKEYVKPLLLDSVPLSIQKCMPAISSAVMLFLVTRYGVTTIAAYGVTNKLEIFLFYPAMAMDMGITTIVGQCIGAGRADRVKDYMKCSVEIGSLFIAVISILIIAFSGQLSGLFIRSSEAAVIVKNFFQIVSVGYVLYMITSCFLGQLSGMGKPGMSMMLMFVYYIVIRVPLACILVNTGLNINGIWIAILISHIAAAVIASLKGIYELKKLDMKSFAEKTA